MFAPAYDAPLDQKTTAAYEGVSHLTANVELGTYSSPDSYAAAADQYAQVLADLSVAEVRAGALPVETHGTSRNARQHLINLVRGCRDQVLRLARIHKGSGLQQAAGETTAANTTCGEAARAAAALK